MAGGEWGSGWGCAVAGVALTAVAAAAVVPRFLGSTCRGGNSTAAIATLRNLGHVQREFRDGLRVDLDGDGRGEFGTLGELTATAGLRADRSGAARGAPLAVPVLSPALAGVDADGIVSKSGHHFRIVLPGEGGRPVREGIADRRGRATGGCVPREERQPLQPVRTTPPGPPPSDPFTGPVDTDAAEETWCAYSWPVAAGNSGQRVFFVDASGEVWQTGNADGRYSGRSAGPSWDAAMPEDGWGAGWGSPPPGAKQYRGRDGNLWLKTN